MVKVSRNSDTLTKRVTFWPFEHSLLNKLYFRRVLEVKFNFLKKRVFIL